MTLIFLVLFAHAPHCKTYATWHLDLNYFAIPHIHFLRRTSLPYQRHITNLFVRNLATIKAHLLTAFLLLFLVRS